MSRRDVTRWAAVFLTLGAATFVRGDGVPDPARFQRVRELLAEFSLVTDGASAGRRDVISTRIEAHPDPGTAVLSYRRASYTDAGADSLATEQIIQYTVRLGMLDPGSVRARVWEGFNADKTFWLVHATTRGEDDFMPYTNLFQRRLEDGAVDLTSSRGRVREVVIGYFTTEESAHRLAGLFRDMLEDLAPAVSDV